MYSSVTAMTPDAVSLPSATVRARRRELALTLTIRATSGQ